jgi:hypothetical protein
MLGMKIPAGIIAPNVIADNDIRNINAKRSEKTVEEYEPSHKAENLDSLHS